MMTEEQIIEAAIQGHASTRDAIRWAMNQVRKDAEPVAYEAAGELWAADDPSINNYIRENSKPLYAHPAPAVLRQLVDALQVAVDSDLGVLWVWPESAKEIWLKNANAALAAAKEARL